MSELTNAEVVIVGEVVHEFLTMRKPTPRLPLLKIARDLEVLGKLARWSILRPLDDNKFLPLALAFHYCGDTEALGLAKQSVKLIGELLKPMFENCDEENKQYYLPDIEQAARQRYGSVDTEKIWLGLYLGDELRLCSKRGPQPWEITTALINEHIIEIENTETVWDEYVKDRTNWIRGQISGIPKPSQTDLHFEEENHEERISVQHSKRVFLVHGRANDAKGAVAGFLRDLALDVVILHEKPNEGQTIVEKFETYADVGFAVVLLTPDDVGAPATEPDKARKRARQNVILELGYFIGKLGRKRVCPLYVQGVELPSDIHGVLYVPYDETATWRSQLLKEITAAGIEVKLRNGEDAKAAATG